MGKFYRLGALLLVGCLVAAFVTSVTAHQQYVEDDADFMDFDGVQQKDSSDDMNQEEDFEDDFPDDGMVETETDEQTHLPIEESVQEDEAAVEENEDLYENSFLSDEEEFIGYTADSSSSNNNNNNNNNNKKGSTKEPKITIADVPLHLRSNWDSYYLEIMLLVGLVIYFANFTYGRNKNAMLATSWFTSHKPFLTQQFALVGDDGKSAAGGEGTEGAEKSVVTASKGCYDLLKESEHTYSLYCSGRYSVHSMMVELRFIKRQDLVSLVTNVFRPTTDEAILKLRLDDMDSFVFCLATKKVTTKYVKEMTDIITYCPGDRKTTLPTKQYGAGGAKVSVWAELSEASQAMITDPRTIAVIGKNLPRINYLHISDQYSGPRQQEQDQTPCTTQLEVQKVLIMSVQLPSAEEEMDQLRPFMMLAMHLADKLSRYRLTRESKAKAVKNRNRVEELFLKATHVARAERAQEKKEVKRREEREKIMEIDDPERQRKWEEKENKRLAKKKGPKMKQLKIA